MTDAGGSTDGAFFGTGIFDGEGFCEGDASSFITDDKDAAIANGFPAAVTLEQPSTATA